MILFAYASNMYFEDFATHIPSAKNLGVAYLPGYEFVFNKIDPDGSAKANITRVETPNAAVWGILIALSEEDRMRVFNPDQDWAEHLELVPLNCTGADGETYEAEVFISRPHAVSNFLLPYDRYQEKIITFARWQHLPEEYINQLSHMESKPDPDEKRRERRLKKFRK